MPNSAGLQHFNNLVGLKFQLYNSLFTSLPFHRIEKTGILLSMLLNNCEEGFRKKLSPSQIINDFFSKHTGYTKEQEKLDLLFRFVQYVERQVVLFDALEDAAFNKVNDMNGSGTLKQLTAELQKNNYNTATLDKLKQFCIRIVLTAHPTQFYPGSVLGIINDLAKAIADDNITAINQYLQQLGKTPFLKKQKPTPYDEAVSLIWYLENVFYAATGRVISYLKKNNEELLNHHPVVQLGFWPGGDKDGNPFVTSSITLSVADALRSSIIKCYYMDVRRLKRRLTFEGVEQPLADLEKKLYNNIFIPGQRTNLSKEEIINTLEQIRQTIIYNHNSLFVQLVESLITKVETFGLHFATLDIRQESSVHGKVLHALINKGNNLQLLNAADYTNKETAEETIVTDTLDTINAIKTIQQYNGVQGCHRYIISQCQSAANVLEVMELFLQSGWAQEQLNIDIVPLFETIDDLRNAGKVMHTLYTHAAYRTHLQKRSNKQTIMLGFSDGTKDGGYLMANWSIYKAKEELSAVAQQYNIEVVFFDGRGGPPSRGGGKTHKFYASMGKHISGNEIQLTVQGQTVSSNYGTIDAAQFNMEQLINAGITNQLYNSHTTILTEAEEKLLYQLASASYEKYASLKNHPGFMDYLSHVSPLRYYSDTNIGSRPAKRSSGSKLSLKDLRAIPYVGSWAQLKQNVTGYFGVGTALKQMQEQGHFAELQKLYNQSLFIRTLLGNCEMALKKCFFPLTAYLMNHPQYGELWNTIHDEYLLTKQMVLQLSGHTELMEEYPVEQLSVQMRERIVLPLLTIQQYAIAHSRELQEKLISSPLQPVYEKLTMRCSFGIINAARNSA
ncbi:MAG: phosphoenolpyruvate carboxylase [Chitinophagaceae bacterium]|nr:phosphoenolpyruvate carboxylase [Chitinophagaceae bacterium]